jgi:hypothetical protein
MSIAFNDPRESFPTSLYVAFILSLVSKEISEDMNRDANARGRRWRGEGDPGIPYKSSLLS